MEFILVLAMLSILGNFIQEMRYRNMKHKEELCEQALESIRLFWELIKEAENLTIRESLKGKHERIEKFELDFARIISAMNGLHTVEVWAKTAEEIDHLRGVLQSFVQGLREQKRIQIEKQEISQQYMHYLAKLFVHTETALSKSPSTAIEDELEAARVLYREARELASKSEADIDWVQVCDRLDQGIKLLQKYETREDFDPHPSCC